MDKIILRTGVFLSISVIVIAMLNYVSFGPYNIFYWTLAVLVFPTTFILQVPIRFGAIGPGDVLGFIYLSDAILMSVFYILIGFLSYKILRHLRHSDPKL